MDTTGRRRAHALTVVGVRAVSAFLATTALLLSGCPDWRETADPSLVSKAPLQTPLEGAPIQLPFGDVTATLVPRARYALTAYALITDNTMFDPWADVAGLDITFGWGPVASPAILRHLSLHLRRRYVSVRWDAEMPLSSAVVMQHLSNHHLIAGDPDVAKTLGKIRPGDLVEMEGALVDLTVRGRRMRTSLTRDDTGNGACEVLFVERVAVRRP